jgi:5-methylcytosine-specific restriction endonuclease McrA
MPIDYNLYHPKWKLIRRLVLKRARHTCEGCGIPNYAVGYRNEEGRFKPTYGNVVHDLAGQGISYPSMRRITYKEAKDIADLINEYEDENQVHYFVIVITIAHLDQNINNNRFQNLKALCQKCHLAHDRRFRISKNSFIAPSIPFKQFITINDQQ